MGVFKWFFFFVLSIIMIGCNTPFVPVKKEKTLHIASNFLKAEDSVHFRGFEKKMNIQVVIHDLTVDSIISHFKQYKYNASFDLVLMKSVYDLNKLSKAKVLHPISSKDQWENKGFVSPKSDWILLGIDPYVVVGDSIYKGFQYKELTYGKKWSTDLRSDDLACFQSAVIYQFGRKNLKSSLSWLEKINAQIAEGVDSIGSYSLTKLSHLKDKKINYVYPNQSYEFGVLYDGVGIGIVRHSSKYLVGCEMLNYYKNIVFNQKICNAFHILPAQNPKELSAFAYQNDYPIIFRCTPREMAPIFRDLKRVRTRI